MFLFLSNIDFIMFTDDDVHKDEAREIADLKSHGEVVITSVVYNVYNKII